MNGPHITLSQLSRYYGISEEFASECVKLGIIPAVQPNVYDVPESEWRFNLATLPHYVNIEAAARILDVSERTVKRYVQNHHLKCYRPKNQYKFLLRWIEEYRKSAETI